MVVIRWSWDDKCLSEIPLIIVDTFDGCNDFNIFDNITNDDDDDDDCDDGNGNDDDGNDIEDNDSEDDDDNEILFEDIDSDEQQLFLFNIPVTHLLVNCNLYVLLS